MNLKERRQGVGGKKNRKIKVAAPARKATVNINPLIYCCGVHSVSVSIPHYDAHNITQEEHLGRPNVTPAPDAVDHAT